MLDKKYKKEKGENMTNGINSQYTVWGSTVQLPDGVKELSAEQAREAAEKILGTSLADVKFCSGTF